MEYALGVIISLVVMGMKQFKETNVWTTYVLLAAVSIVFGGLYAYISAQEYFSAIVQAVVYAAAFHNLVLRRLTN